MTMAACPAPQQAEIKTGIAGVLEEVLHKSESGLCVTFTHPDGFYRAGAASQDGAIVDLSYIGQFSLAKKQEVTRRISTLLQQTLSLNPAEIIVLFKEMPSENWGRKAGDYE